MTKSRILIVEDEPFVARDIRQQLVELGYEPVADTPRGEEAIALAGQLRPDLVLMDIHLEGDMDGIAAAQAIHDRFDLPVVFLTAFAGEETLDRAKKSDPFGYIIKPFDERELRIIIEMALYKHQAESLLRQGREEQEAILRTTLDGFWLVDLQGHIVDVNESSCRMLGYTRNEILGKPITSFDADESAAGVAATIGQIKELGSAKFERRHRCKDGRLIDVELSVNQLPGDAGRLAAFIRDTTERKRMELALRMSEERATKAFRTIPDGIVISRIADGRVLEVNEGFCSLAGLTREEALGRCMPELDLWDQMSDRDSFIETLRKQGFVKGMEATFHNKSGDHRIISLSAELMDHDQDTLVLTITRDITEGKRAEQALRASEIRNRAMTQSAYDAIISADSAGNIMGWNHGAEILFGYTEAEATGQPLTLLAPARFHKAHLAGMDRIRSGGESRIIGKTVEMVGLRRDGSEFPLELALAKWETAEGWFVTGIVRDITERVRAGEELRQVVDSLRRSETKFRTLYDSDPDGVMLLGEHGFFDCNKATLEIFGCADRDAFFAKHPADLSPALQPCGTDSLTLAKQRIAATLESGSQRFEWVHKRADTGASFAAEVLLTPMELDGKRILQAVVRDITERKRAEEALRESEETHRSILNASPDDITITDMEGRILLISAAATSMFGYEPGEEVGKQLFDFIVPEDAERARSNLMLMYQGGAHAPNEYRGVRKDQSQFDIEVRSAFIRDGDGRPTKMVFIVRDITERKRIDEALRENEDRFRDLLDNSQEVIATYDLDGNFLSVNETAVRISGHPREALLKMNLVDLIAPKMQHLFPDYLATVRTKGKAHGIMQIKTSEGAMRYWEYDSTLRTDGVAVPIVRGMALDITERLRSEKALRANESQLQVILESTDDGILAVDQKGRILKTNRRFAELWQISQSLLAGGDDQKLLDYVLAQVADPDAFLEKVHSLYASDKADLDLIHFKDGRCFERFSSPMLDGTVITGRVWSFRDITERRRAEQAVRENEKVLRESQIIAGLGSYVLDAATGIWSSSDVLDAIFGIDETFERTTAGWASLIHPDDRPWMVDYFQNEVIGKHVRFDREYRIVRHRDQAVRWVHGLGELEIQSETQLLKMHGTIQDITERKQGAEALRESHERFELANRATFNVLWDWNLKTNVIWRNDNFGKLFGYAGSEVGAGFESSDNLIHPDDLESVRAGIHVALDNPKSEFWADQYRFRRKDGVFATVEDRGIITRDADGHAIRMLGAMQDITERKEAEGALRQSEEKLRVIVEHSAQLFYSHTSANMLTYVSPQVEAFLETDPDDTYRPWTDFLTENPINAIGVELTQRAIETGERQPPYELELLSARGRILWVEVHESPVVEMGKTVAIVGALTDITESKRTRDQLRLKSSALESAANAILITDRMGVIQWTNPAFTTLTGYSLAEAIGSRPGDLVRSGMQDQAFYAAMWADILAGEVWRGELVNRRKDGSFYTGEKVITPLIDDRGTITNFIAVEQDITDRKRAEASLRLQGGALEAAANAIVITDRQGVIEWANPAFTAFTGYTAAEAIGKLPSELIKSGKHDPAFYKAMWDTISAGGVWMGEVINKRKDGSLYTEEMTITPLKNDQDEIIHFVAVKQDITQRKQAEQELSHLNRSLKMLSACNEALVRADNERELLSVICQIAIDIGGYRMAWVGYAQDDAGRAITPMAYAGEEDGYLTEMKVTWSEDEPSGMGPAGLAIRTGQASVFADITDEPGSFHWLEAMRQRGYRGVISLPLRGRDRIFGVFILYSAEVFQLAEKDLELLQEMADDLAFGIGSIRSQVERKQMQQAVLKMAQGVSGGTGAAFGEAFFDLMVASLVEALGAAGGIIGRLSGPEADAVRTLSFIAGDQKLENLSYDLPGTPCELVSIGETCLFDRDVQGLFPQDRMLVDFGVQAYAGTPLQDSKGRTLGLLAVFFKARIENPELVKSTLRIFAARAAGELERQETDSRIREQASLLDKAHDAISVRDMDHKMLFWNKGAERLYGWTAQELIGRSVVDLFYPDPAAFREAQEVVLAEGEWSGRIQHQRKDGNLLTVEGHWTLVRDEQDQPRSILAINTDITEKVQAEHELQQYTERLEAMRGIDAALLGARSTMELTHGALARLRHIVPFQRAAVVLFDPGLTEGSILAVDQDEPWLPLAGESRPIGDFHDLKDLLSAPFLDLADLSEIQGCIMEELMLSQGLRNLVYVPMESEGKVLGFLALSTTAPGALTPQHAEIALDMTDQLVVAIQHTRMREELELSNQLLETKVEKRTADLRSTVATLQIMEGELRQREAEAQAASQAKSTFLASMSHELRTPLIGVTGMLEMLTLSDLDAEQRQVVNIIHESSESLLQIIGDILDFSKIEANKLELAPQTFSVRALIDSVSQSFSSPISAKGLAFVVKVDPRIAPAHVADAMRIRQILNNFLSNAVKFTESGSITLRLALLGSSNGSESLAFEVKDTGIGVSLENQGRLFEPFTQAEASTTRRFGGTGLGLTISRRMAELMGGSLTMHSVLGQGTTMTLALDLTVGKVQDIVKVEMAELLKAVPKRTAPTIEAAEQERSLILMAEDHPTNRFVLTQQVNRAGFALEAAVDGQEAFEKWQSGRFALILTDLHMPRMDGYQLTKAVRDWERAHNLPRTPILALTANALRGEAVRCMDLGMDDYLIKPVTIPQMASRLYQWMPQVKAGNLSVGPAAPSTVSPDSTEGIPGVDSKRLLDLGGGDATAAQEILNDFIATTKSDMNVLRDALKQQDKPCILRQSHRIKGSSAMVGALDLADRATQLEAYAKTGSAAWTTIQEHLAGIQEALEALEKTGSNP